MLALLPAVLCLSLGPKAPATSAPEVDLAAQVSAILLRAEEPDAEQTRAALAELASLGPLADPLLALLADWRTPDGAEEEGAALNEAQQALVLELVAALPRATWKPFLDGLARSEDPGALRAGLRLQGALVKASSLRTLFDLAARASQAGRFEAVASAFEQGLATALARDAKCVDVLRSAWRELDTPRLECALRALERRPSPEVVDCLWSWLGRCASLDASVLLALGNLHALVPPARRAALANDVQGYLASGRSEVIQAAATTLGRIGAPATVPWLIELLVHEDRAVQRAALGALRSIGGMRLPGSTTAWRSWYAREETWFQEHAPALLEELVGAEESADPVPQTGALLRSLTEHRLHRDELAEHIFPLLSSPRPRQRVLACQAFERLASRRALPWLVSALSDEIPGVVSAAHAALQTLEGVTLGTEPEAWCERLGLPVPVARP